MNFQLVVLAENIAEDSILGDMLFDGFLLHFFTGYEPSLKQYFAQNYNPTFVDMSAERAESSKQLCLLCPIWWESVNGEEGIAGRKRIGILYWQSFCWEYTPLRKEVETTSDQLRLIIGWRWQNGLHFFQLKFVEFRLGSEKRDQWRRYGRIIGSASVPMWPWRGWIDNVGQIWLVSCQSRYKKQSATHYQKVWRRQWIQWMCSLSEKVVLILLSTYNHWVFGTRKKLVREYYWWHFFSANHFFYDFSITALTIWPNLACSFHYAANPCQFCVNEIRPTQIEESIRIYLYMWSR